MSDDHLELFQGLSIEFKDEFIQELAAVIQRWLEKRDIEKLSFYLYRIDVPEFVAQKVLNSPKTVEEKALQLSKMMVERHLEKRS